MRTIQGAVAVAGICQIAVGYTGIAVPIASSDCPGGIEFVLLG